MKRKEWKKSVLAILLAVMMVLPAVSALAEEPAEPVPEYPAAEELSGAAPA